MSKGVLWVVAALVVLAGGWWALSSKSSAPAQTGPIMIGASLPLTGEAASYGEMIKPGIELAVKEINDAGGVNGRPLAIIYEDDKCSKDGANTFTKFVNIDKVTAIVGSICSAAVGPGVPIAQQGGVPTIIWGSAPGLTLAGDYIFRTYPSDSLQGVFAADYIYKTMGKKRVAVLYTNNPWGEGLEQVFSKRFAELGGTVVASEGANQDSTDLRTQLTKMKSVNPELIYIPLYPANAGAAVKQAKTLGMKMPLFGGDALEAKEFLSIPESSGVMYTISKISQPDEFKAKVKQATGAEAGFLTPLAYDTVKILAQVMTKVGTDRKAIRDELKNLDYTAGVAQPTISFDENRDLKTAQFDVKVVKNGKGEVMQ